MQIWGSPIIHLHGLNRLILIEPCTFATHRRNDVIRMLGLVMLEAEDDDVCRVVGAAGVLPRFHGRFD